MFGLSVIDHKKAFGVILISLLFMLLNSNVAFSLNLVMFHTPSCYACQKWDEEIGPKYSKTDEAELAPLVKEDAFEIPKKYQLRSSIHFTPTFVLMENNKEISRIIGYTREDYFWFFLGEELKKVQKK